MAIGTTRRSPVLATMSVLLGFLACSCESLKAEFIQDMATLRRDLTKPILTPAPSILQSAPTITAPTASVSTDRARLGAIALQYLLNNEWEIVHVQGPIYVKSGYLTERYLVVTSSKGLRRTMYCKESPGSFAGIPEGAVLGKVALTSVKLLDIWGSENSLTVDRTEY